MSGGPSVLFMLLCACTPAAHRAAQIPLPSHRRCFAGAPGGLSPIADASGQSQFLILARADSLLLRSGMTGPGRIVVPGSPSIATTWTVLGDSLVVLHHGLHDGSEMIELRV